MAHSSPAASAAPAFGGTFWALNSIEMLERLAYYTLRVMAPIYIMQADDPGGLHLAAEDKGRIYLLWAVFQSGLPIVTGGLADRYGYKRTLIFSISMMTLGYLMVALLRDIPGVSNYTLLLISILTLATGTAFFKPSIQGSLAQILTKANSSVGWGVFYWVVNVGAFVGHFLPAFFLWGEHTPAAWRNLFLVSAVFMSLNFLILIFLRDTPSGASQTDSPLVVLQRTIVNLFEPRLLAWLLIMSGFWMMMYQLWDTQPNFIADWVDSAPLAGAVRDGLGVAPLLARAEGDGAALSGWESFRLAIFRGLTQHTPRGYQIPQNVLLSLNSFFIIIGVVGMAWLTRRMRTLTAMVGGIILATAGVVIAGWTMSPWILILGILCFSLGEMTTGPKKSEYLSLIAPPDKKGLYLGYVNIPTGIGQGIGNEIAGHVYGNFGEKAVLALRYLAERTPMGREKGWDGSVASLEKALGVSRPEAMQKLQEVTGLDATAATQLLWDTYDPQFWVWLPFAAIGISAAIALVIFGQMAKRWKDMNA